jgi:hypothetical protein
MNEMKRIKLKCRSISKQRGFDEVSGCDAGLSQGKARPLAWFLLFFLSLPLPTSSFFCSFFVILPLLMSFLQVLPLLSLLSFISLFPLLSYNPPVSHFYFLSFFLSLLSNLPLFILFLVLLFLTFSIFAPAYFL